MIIEICNSVLCLVEHYLIKKIKIIIDSNHINYEVNFYFKQFYQVFVANFVLKFDEGINDILSLSIKIQIFNNFQIL